MGYQSLCDRRALRHSNQIPQKDCHEIRIINQKSRVSISEILDFWLLFSIFRSLVTVTCLCFGLSLLNHHALAVGCEADMAVVGVVNPGAG